MRHLLIFLLAIAPVLIYAQNNYTLISNTNVIDVRSGKVIKEASVLIKDDLIQEVFTNKKMKLPPGTTVLDGTSKYVMPGMTDAHIHFFQSGGLYTRPDAFDFTHIVPYQKEREFTFNNTSDYFRRYLRMGITTVADVGGPMSNFIIRDSISKTVISPHVLVTGPLFSMVDDKPLDNGEPPIIRTTTIEKADSLLDKMLPLKPDYIKIWYIVTPELPAEKTFPVVQHIAKRTHDAKLKLAVHATELRTADLAVDAGADILVHSVEDEIVTDAFVKKLVDKKVSYIPTLIVANGYYRAISGELDHHQSDLYFANPFVYGSLSDPEHMTDKELPGRFKRFRSLKNRPSYAREDSIMAVNLKKLHNAGVNIVAGTDAGNIGTMHASSFLIELEAMKKAGLTNAQILKTATLNSATCFNQHSGVVEKGRRADLAVLSKNPLEEISAVGSVDFVIKSGKVVKTDTLIKESPEMLVQRQLNAYNARNLDAFLDTYDDNVELYNFPDSLIGKGKEKMRPMYEGMFNKVKNLHCQIVDRIKLGNTIIDHERVRFNKQIVDAVAIYEVKNGKIVKVTFKE
jgi:imidazolonepropionase-like amidohydrolase